MPLTSSEGRNSVAELIELLMRDGKTVSVAESLTGGLVMTALTSIPGASAVVCGGVVAYTSAIKRDILGVDADLLAERGAVDADVAVAMARGIRELFGSDFGLSTTGVAGPEGQDGKSPGVVFVALDSARGTRFRELLLEGSRDEIRTQSAVAVLELLRDGMAD